MFSDVSVLSEVVHIRFSAKNWAYLAFGQFFKPVVLYVVARFHLGMLLLDTDYAMLAIRVLELNYCHPTFEWLDYCLVDFGSKRPRTWLFVLKEEEMLAIEDFVRLSTLHNLCKN